MIYGKNRPSGFGESNAGLTDSDVEDFVHRLDSMPPVERSGRAMKIASRLLEYAAFELAGRQSATFVADLVDASAKIENSSSEVLGAPLQQERCRISRLQ